MGQGGEERNGGRGDDGAIDEYRVFGRGWGDSGDGVEWRNGMGVGE